jgi:hypothetical protein
MTTWIDLAGWTLVHFVWQGALIAAAAWGGLHVLRTAPARYALACAALACMLAAPPVTAWMLSRTTTALSPSAPPLGTGGPIAVVLPDVRSRPRRAPRRPTQDHRSMSRD